MFFDVKFAVVLLSVVLLTGCMAHSPNRFKPFQQNPPKITDNDYRIYDAEGNPALLDDIIAASASADVLFVGEEHDDPTAHFLEAEILKALRAFYRQEKSSALRRPLILSLEMFERDVQLVVDEYLADLITERHFLKSGRAWHNYRTDYRALVGFARDQQIPVIAANAPGRYVNRVARLGRTALDDLSPTVRSWLPPMPWAPASPEYRAKFRAFWDESLRRQQALREKMLRKAKSLPMRPTADMEKFDFDNLLDAQALRDAAMADAIAQALAHRPGALVVNVNGKFHSAGELGIPEHLRNYRPAVRMLTVTIRSGKNFPDLDEADRGNGTFVILTNPELLRPSFMDRLGGTL